MKLLGTRQQRATRWVVKRLTCLAAAISVVSSKPAILSTGGSPTIFFGSPIRVKKKSFHLESYKNYQIFYYWRWKILKMFIFGSNLYIAKSKKAYTYNRRGTIVTLHDRYLWDYRRPVSNTIFVPSCLVMNMQLK